MLVAGVIHHEIGDDPDPAAVGVLHERYQVVDVADIGCDVRKSLMS